MKIILSDNTEIDNLTLNGNNFVSQVEITEEMFRGKLSKVIIEDGENTEELSNVELVQIAHYSDGWYFVLRELTEKELKDMKVRADIEYIAMMTDVDLEV